MQATISKYSKTGIDEDSLLSREHKSTHEVEHWLDNEKDIVIRVDVNHDNTTAYVESSSYLYLIDLPSGRTESLAIILKLLQKQAGRRNIIPFKRISH
jgi:hypothetical protein